MIIAICDDNKEFRLELQKHLKNYYSDKCLSIEFLHFASGEELLETEKLFDMVFLDVEMGGMNGIDTGEQLNIKNPNCIIFVITSFDGYLDDAFKIRAFRFLPKPIEVLRLYTALGHAAELMNNETIAFHDSESGQDIRIYSRNIIYLEVEKRKTKVVTTKKTYLSKENIAYWKLNLKGTSFISPHSSYIANLNYAVSHVRKMLVLANKDAKGDVLEQYSITIAPAKQSEMKKIFFDFMDRR